MLMHLIPYSISKGNNKMKTENNKVWLYLDQALRKLQSISHWTTSADPWYKDIEEAKSLLKEALRKLEVDK